MEVEPLWSIAEVAAYLNVKVSTIYRMTGKKSRRPIPHVRVGGLRFRKFEIDQWLDLISISNMDVLRKARDRAKGVRSGNHPQTEDRQQ